MTEQSQYIDVSELPQHMGARFPYNKWVQDIPEGKLLEITESVNGKKSRAAIAQTIKNGGLPLRIISRGDRLFILKVAPA